MVAAVAPTYNEFCERGERAAEPQTVGRTGGREQTDPKEETGRRVCPVRVSVAFRLDGSLSEPHCDAVFDRFVADAIEPNHLVCGGGGKCTEWEVYVHPAGHATATEQHRNAVRVWFDAIPEVVDYSLGPLTDAWYGPFEDLSAAPWIPR